MAKNYSIIVEDDNIIAVEIDGVRYDSPDDIPDPTDQANVRRLISSLSNDSDEAEIPDFFDMDDTPEVGVSPSTQTFSIVPTIIVSTFLAIAVLMITISAISAVRIHRAIANEEKAAGQVVDLTTRKDKTGNEFSYPIVEFYLPDQTRQRVQLAEGSWPPAYQKGDPVTVLYDPEQPRNARIDSVSSTILMWILPAITGVIGAAFLGATWVAHWVAKPDAATNQKKP